MTPPYFDFASQFFQKEKGFNKVLMASLRYAQILLTQNFIKTIINRNKIGGLQ